MAQALPDPVVDPETVRRTVDEVLAQPEYAPLEPGLVERALGWLAEQVGRLVELIARGGAGGLVAALLVLAGVVVVVVLAARFTRRLRRDPGAEAPVAGEVGRRAADWHADAAEHEAAGRWRPALRCRYRALVAELAADGLVDEVPGRTTGEYLRQACAALPAAAEPLAAATAAFDAAWYGHAAVDADAVATFRGHAEAVSAALRGRRAPVGSSA